MPSPVLLDVGARAGLCLEEVVGVRQGSYEDLRGPGSAWEEALGEETVAFPKYQREKTNSQKTKLGLVGKQNWWSGKTFLTVQLPGRSGN